MWGAYPVIVSYGTKTMPPLTFAALSVLVAAAGSFAYAAATRTLGELRERRAVWPLLVIAVCGIIIPPALYFLGASKTSSVNAALLLLSEIIFTVIFTPFIGEKNTVLKISGAAIVLFGAAIILYRPGAPVVSHSGDLLIILSTVLYPFSNFYGKKVLHLLSPATILFARFFIGGIFLFIIARLIEPSAAPLALFIAHWPLITSYSLIILVFSRILWYKGLKQVDISKAVLLGMTFPAFSMLILFMRGEPISTREWVGFAVLMVGTMLVVLRPSVDQTTTKYAAPVNYGPS